MKISAAGIALIKEFEALRLKAYVDPGTGGEPITIGWGTTGVVTLDDGSIARISLGMTCTPEQADRWLLERLGDFERDVNELVKVNITQNQFDALTSFAYNVGPDMDHDGKAEGLGDSTLLKKLNSGDILGAAAEFAKWNRSGGRVMPGLTRRRADEKALFLTP